MKVDSRSQMGKMTAIGSGDFGKNLKSKVSTNSRGMIIGGVIGTILALHFKKPLIPSGIVGLLLGKVLLKLK